MLHRLPQQLGGTRSLTIIPPGITSWPAGVPRIDRKSTRLNSSHANISYAVFCLKKKKNNYLYSIIVAYLFHILFLIRFAHIIFPPTIVPHSYYFRLLYYLSLLCHFII